MTFGIYAGTKLTKATVGNCKLHEGVLRRVGADVVVERKSGELYAIGELVQRHTLSIEEDPHHQNRA